MRPLEQLLLGTDKFWLTPALCRPAYGYAFDFPGFPELARGWRHGDANAKKTTPLQLTAVQPSAEETIPALHAAGSAAAEVGASLCAHGQALV